MAGGSRCLQAPSMQVVVRISSRHTCARSAGAGRRACEALVFDVALAALRRWLAEPGSDVEKAAARGMSVLAGRPAFSASSLCRTCSLPMFLQGTLACVHVASRALIALGSCRLLRRLLNDDAALVAGPSSSDENGDGAFNDSLDTPNSAPPSFPRA